MLAHLVNLDSSTDRLAFMAAQFEALGMAFERMSASDGLTLLAAAPDDVYRHHRRNRRLRIGEVGCFDSHLRIWRAVAAGEASMALVFEDDVLLSSALPAVAAALPGSGLDLVKLETVNKVVRVARGGAVRVGDRSALPMASRHMGSAGYAISRRAAAWLAEHAVIDRSVDQFLFARAGLRGHPFPVHQVSPGVAIQTQFLAEAGIVADRTIPGLDSTIGYDHGGFRRLVKRIRRATERAAAAALPAAFEYVPFA